MLTKILAAKITNETNKLQENDSIIRGTIRKVTVCRTVSWEVVIVNSVIIDRENISLAHSSKGNGKDTKFCSRTLNTLRISNLRQTPQYYYEFGKFAIMRRNLSIFISVKLPITPHNVRYKVFKILAFPVPVNESSPHATQLFDVNDYFIISSNRQFYTTLAQSALNQCQGRNLMISTLHPMLRTSAKITCEAALFLNDKEKIKEICNFRFLFKKIKPHILELPPSKILIYQISSFTLM